MKTVRRVLLTGLISIAGLPFQAMAFAPSVPKPPTLPARFSDFAPVDAAGQALLKQISEGSWERKRDISIKVCEYCDVQHAQVDNRLILNASATSLSAQYIAESGGSTEGSFTTGQGTGKLTIVAQKMKSDGSVEVLYGVDPSTGNAVDHEYNKIAIAALDSDFFTAPDADNLFQTLLDKHGSLGTVYRCQYIALSLLGLSPNNKLSLECYSDGTKDPTVLLYFKTDPSTVRPPWGNRPWYEN